MKGHESRLKSMLIMKAVNKKIIILQITAGRQLKLARAARNIQTDEIVQIQIFVPLADLGPKGRLVPRGLHEYVLTTRVVEHFFKIHKNFSGSDVKHRK
jgi:hypothetical protein